MLKNFKRCRQELELTQKELGKIMGVTQVTICGWETGRDYISLSNLVDFCNKYKFTIDYVVGSKKTNTNFKTIPPLDKKRIGKSIKALRKSFYFSQKKLASECGIHRSTISDYENGKTLITALNLYIICKKHKISMDKFLSM